MSGNRMSIYRIVLIHSESDYGLCRAINISDGGMTIILGFECEVGESVTVEFSDYIVLPAKVRWTNTGKAGLEFDEAIEASELLQTLTVMKGHGLYRAPRMEVNTIAAASTAAGTQAVRVLNISQGGMKISHDGALEVGSRVRIKLNDSLEKQAVVRWVSGRIAGLMMLNPIAHQELERASRLQLQDFAPANLIKDRPRWNQNEYAHLGSRSN